MSYHWLFANGVSAFQLTFANNDGTASKSSIIFLSSRGLVLGSVDLQNSGVPSQEYLHGILAVTGVSVALVVNSYDPQLMTTKFLVKNYRFQGGTALLTKTTELPGADYPQVFSPATMAGGMLITGYDDPSSQTGFWIRRWSAF